MGKSGPLTLGPINPFLRRSEIHSFLILTAPWGRDNQDVVKKKFDSFAEVQSSSEILSLFSFILLLSIGPMHWAHLMNFIVIAMRFPSLYRKEGTLYSSS